MKDVINPNVAKLLQKKRQMEDTGGDYIYEEEKGTPGSKGHYKKDMLRGTSRQGIKPQMVLLPEDYYENESSTHTLPKSGYYGEPVAPQLPHIARNQYGPESYYPKVSSGIAYTKEKSMVFFFGSL